MSSLLPASPEENLQGMSLSLRGGYPGPPDSPDDEPQPVMPPVGLDLNVVDFGLVLEDAAQLKARLAAEHGPDRVQRSPFDDRVDRRVSIALWDSICEHDHALKTYIEWLNTFPHLFKFFIVPEQLQCDVIWVEELKLEALVTAPGWALACIGVNDEDARTRQIFVTRWSLAQSLMDHNVGRYAEALEHLECNLKHHQQFLRTSGSPNAPTPWKETPHMYVVYALVRVLTNHFDMETKRMMERVLDALESSPLGNRSSQTQSWAILHMHMCLALVLQVLEVEPQNQKKHTDWAVKYLRKRRFLNTVLEPVLRKRFQPAHPVFLALGEQWFEKEEVLLDAVKLLRCNGCRTVQYCSRECQRTHWPMHRELCKARKAQDVAQAQRQNEDPLLSRAKKEFPKWLRSENFANNEALVHSLDLQRDMSRHRTHISLRRMDYFPQKRNLADRFVVVDWSVHKIDEVLPCMTIGFRKSEADLRKMIDAYLEPPAQNVGDTVMLLQDVRFRNLKMKGFMFSCPYSKTVIAHMPLDPLWRDKVNPSGVPAPIETTSFLG
ncbi:hypothetical protein EIP91_008699 [Steccherinum ochraceum]|uniref:MYND-type domain-containing protein n=1 Tax=Steccherinum ochraceum TaxID=92696 RepID=A0A4R0R4T0_9APHY|nr:hypothetical protein EIP91_008699 [Steccherinum ochraceum]